MLLRAAVLLLLVTGSALLTAADEKAGPEKVGSPKDPQAKAFAEWQQQMTKMFDANGDGKLSDQEKLMAQEAMRRQGINMGMGVGGFDGAEQFNKRFDRNGDGKLDQMESMAAQAAFQKMRGNGGMRGGIQTGGGVQTGQPGGDGSGGGLQPVLPVGPQNDKKPKSSNPVVNRFDKDGDGKLNDAEKAAVQAERKKKDGKKEKK